jgi:Alkylmercury lyase
MLERTAEEEAVLRVAFDELLATPRPAALPRLARRLDTTAAELEPLLARLAERGWIRRRDDGSVVGSRGLTIERTQHELELNGESRFTWCAYDTLGIFAALGANGTIRSRTPLEEQVELEVVDGRPTAADGVVLFFPERQVASVVDEWCPLANFFLNVDAARSWAQEHGVEGQVLTLTEASERGSADWRDCCSSGGSG